MDGEFALDEAEHVAVELQPQIRMKTALQEYLRPPQADGFLYLLKELSPREYIRIGCAGRSVKRAEAATRNADIGVIDIPIDHVRYDWLRMQALPYLIGNAP